MPPAVLMFFGVMVALAVVPVAITISDVVKCRKDNKVAAWNGQENTHSSLRPQHIAKVQYGLGAIRRKEWAVSAPTLRTVSEANGRTHFVFGIRSVV